MSLAHSSSGTKKIRKLSKHSFTNINRGSSARRFSNINTQAVIYNNEDLQQLYTGLYLDDNLHNVGTYRWLSDDWSSSHKFDGKFFLNNMHGYGTLTYPNDAYYEGLFYYNKKLGPGVITYNNGTQDVGLWNGNDLIRLCDKFSASDYYKENIPKLSSLLQSKFYLVQYKRMIPIFEKYKDPAQEMLTKLGAPDVVLGNKSVLYSKYIRNTNSIFLNGEKLYKNFYMYEDELYTTVDVVDHIDDEGNPVITKLEVRNLVAWNNEEINMLISKHAFFNRHQEKILSYKVKDVLCAKKRGNFLPPGPLETRSQKLILACRSKDPRRIKKIITEFNVYPDVADCRGNNTVTYATFANRTKNIKVLAEFGASLNSLNDDGITPLMFGILQYIATIFDITNSVWESAFIYSKAENDLLPCNQQWPKSSNTSISSSETSRFSNNSASRTTQPNLDLDRRYSFVALMKDYMFPLECIHIKRVTNTRKTIDYYSRNKKSLEGAEVAYTRFKIEESHKIMQTISTLLLCGANPNIGEVPFCPIITAIYSKSKDLIQMLISFNANVNAKTSDFHGRLGPLHVIASLAPCLEQLEMAYTFLENGANVDDLSNKTHWLDEQAILLADQLPEDELEKTPLHLVCMRYDFIEDTHNNLIKLALMFLQYGANLNLRHIGHSPLTLAMLRGNSDLIEQLLGTGLVDPNEGLGYNMGVPLTMCVLPRYSKILSYSLVHNLYLLLEKYYANPLNNVPNFEGNAVEFHYVQNTVRNPVKRSSVTRINIGTLLLNIAQSTLLRYIESKVVQTIYNYKIACDFDSPLYHNIVKFLNYPKTCKILQILIDHDVIEPTGTNVQKLLQFVNKKEPGKMVIKKSEEEYPKFYFPNYMPELDPDDDKYKVCFQCFKKTNQILMLCPKCEMVYFCSQECNRRNVKDPDSKHPCKGLFYENELAIASKRKRTTKMDQIINKSIKLQELLSLGNIDMEKFGKMSAKDKRKSLSGIKKQQKEKKAQEAADEEKIKAKKKEESDAIAKKAAKDKKDDKKVGIKTHDDKEETGKASPKPDDSRSLKSIVKSGDTRTKTYSSKEKSTKSGSKSKKRGGSEGEEEAEDEDAEDEAEALKKKRADRLKSLQEQQQRLLKSSIVGEGEQTELDTSNEELLKKKKGKKKSKSIETDRSKSIKFSSNVNVKSYKKDKRSKSSSSKRRGRGEDDDDDEGSRKRKRKSKSRSKSRDSSKRGKSSKSSSTDFGEGKYKKIAINLKNNLKMLPMDVRDGLSVFVGSKIPVIDVEKRNMYLTLRAQMLERDRELNARKTESSKSPRFTEKLKMDKHCTERMLELARKRMPNLPKNFEELDLEFWQLFSPYCIFQNGQLYYNFNDGDDVFYKLTYSTI